MAEIKDSQLIRDALGSPVPQYWDETSKMYIARTVDGGFADVDFSKVRLLRDKLGSPIPQLWDIETAKFVPGKGGLNGEVTIESVPGLRSELDQTNATLAEKAQQSYAEATNLRVDNLVIPISAENANVEVTDAHVSTVKNKTFTTIRNRFEELEESSYFPATNLMVNGDFSSGAVWTAVTATSTSFTPEARFTATAKGGRLQKNITLITGHKYYLSALVTSDSKFVHLSLAGIGNTYHDGIGSKILSMAVEWKSASGGWPVQIVDNRTSGWTETVFDNVVALDLTAIFGAGKEPISSEVDKLLAAYPNSWFDGTKNLIVPKTTIENTLTAQKTKDIVTVNVKYFGAKGDGITNDTVAIQTAVNTLTSGGVLFFPIGTYLVSNISLKSNVLVKGNGVGTTIKLMGGITSGPSNCFTIDSLTNVTIQDIQLDGNRLNNATTGLSADSNFNGVYIANSTDIRLENVWSHSNGYHGCIMAKVSRVTITHCKFTDNGYRPFHGHDTILDSEFSFNECTDNGKGFAGEVGLAYDGIFFFDNVKNILITGNKIINSNNTGCITVGGTAVGLQGSDGIVIANNICIANNKVASGIVLYGELLKNVIITGNTVKNSLIGISAVNGYGDVGESIIITNNIIDGNDIGIEFLSPMKKININGNLVKNSTKQGLSAASLTDSLISNNNFIDNGSDSALYSAVELISASIGNVISSNSFVNSVVGQYQKYGVLEKGTSDSNLITHNNFKNMITGARSSTSTGVNSVAKDNMVNGIYTS